MKKARPPRGSRCTAHRLWRYHAEMSPRARKTVCRGLLLAALAVAPLARADSAAQAAAGAQVFGAAGGAHCHGDHGQGTEIGPRLADVGRRLKPEQISRQIHDGGSVMPAFGSILSGDQIATLVAFLRTQRAKAPHAAPSHAAP